ncbi:UV radiation resistance-associated gene protein isoform X3 [Nannospalax galili]|uniref:UV radiation resistance-associated gene protein isoform X3 n=1 Tax=Nannospalax galili TaxID=1026970 RepID=UPI00111C0B3E|nr:UV radiation resistance-associated gene protein isoform X3 [Nannospalax galili]
MNASASLGGQAPLPPPGPAALPPGSTSRALHVELPSQQRRLRHLRNIAARNIVNRNGYQLLDTYFTLHLCSSEKICKEFYRSEVIKNSLNPTWRSLDFGIMPVRLDTSMSCFVVKIWGGKDDTYQLLIEWKVCLDGLKYLGQQIHARNQNEIVFGLNDGYYGAPFEHKGHLNVQKNILQVDQNCVRNSYDVFSLLRLHRAQCAIKQTQVTVQKIGKEIEEKLRLTSTSNELKKESECLQLKILVLQNELERQKKALGQEVALLHKQQMALQDKGSAFSTEHVKLQLQKESLSELRKECTAKRFPLYPKGGEKLQFDYGVYLLNKNIAQLRYQHGLGTPDLRQTLPNLKNFMEHGLMVRCDRHHTSSAIPVPKRQSSMFGGADVGFSGGIPSPDKGHRKRANSENERLQYKTPPPSYKSALTQPGASVPSVGDPERKAASLSSSLDTSLDFSKESKKTGDLGDSIHRDLGGADTSQSQEALPGHPASVNGTALPSEQPGPTSTQGPGKFLPGAELCCAVEQAEEIIGLEATGFASGEQLEAFSCIPVDSAVAVECDEQVLGEFEEFSRRIYALNENLSSFRRPRRSSDK